MSYRTSSTMRIYTHPHSSTGLRNCGSTNQARDAQIRISAGKTQAADGATFSDTSILRVFVAQGHVVIARK
jgi:hypothetical protein